MEPRPDSHICAQEPAKKTALDQLFSLAFVGNFWQWCGNIDGKPWQDADGFTGARIDH